MKKTAGRPVRLLCLILAGLFLISGCRAKQEETEEKGSYQVYYVNKEETAVVPYWYEPAGTSQDQILNDFLAQLQKTPEDTELKSPIPNNVSVLSYQLESGQLSVYFDTAYLDMSKLYEILCRTAVVRTLCQMPEVDYVSFYIGDKPLMDSNETPIGPMNSALFVENAGEEINTTTLTTLDLYFANQAGDKLVDEKVNVEYSSNMSVEKLVVEQLIKGPITEGAYPTIPRETKLVSVSTKDGTCYVNLDEGFLGQGYDVLEAIPIYSIVNSLTEIAGISKVQILINGETNRIYQESINFETVFERNLDLIEVENE